MSLTPCNDWISIDFQNDNAYLWINLLEEDYASWKDMPKFKLTYENYQKVMQQWNINVENPAPYLILTQDDDGWVSLEKEEELSAEDLDFIKQENLKYERIKNKA